MAKGQKIAGLTLDQPLAESARLIIMAKFREALSYQEAVVAGHDIEDVHHMRVSLRRLWAALRGFQDCFQHNENFSRLARRTRQLARLLGNVRDLDVLMLMLEARAQAQPQGWTRTTAFDYLRRHCTKRREWRREQLLEGLTNIKEDRFAHEFTAFFTNQHNIAADAQATAVSMMSAALENFHAHTVHNSRDKEALHELRIAAKRLRYSLEFFADCLGQRLNSSLKNLRALQELLGDIHDCDVMAEFLIRRRVKLARRHKPSVLLVGLRELTEDFERERDRLQAQFDPFWQENFRDRFYSQLSRILQRAH